VRCHCGPPRHGPRAAVFDRRQQLTLELADAKPGFQDFVIVHELLHLRVPKHGRVFRALMTAYVPGWRKHDATRRLRSGAKSGTA
jgi:predicted metal-dependent hydrolase